MTARMTRRMALPVILFALAASGLIAASKVNADPPATDAKPTQVKQTSPMVEQDVQRCIRELGSDQFKERERARQELRKFGKAALPGLKKALKSGDPEVRSRAQVLIAQIDPPPAPVPAKAPEGAIQVQFQLQGGQLQIQGGQFQIQLVPANPGGVQRTTRTVKISESPQGIVMTVTRSKDGNEVKKEYKAKDAAELEKRHPEAYKLYKGSAELLPDQNKPKK
jgi:hypothetical protein